MAASLTGDLNLNISGFLNSVKTAIAEARNAGTSIVGALRGIPVSVDTEPLKRGLKDAEDQAAKSGSSIADKIKGALSGDGGGILSALGGGAAVGLATGGLVALAGGIANVAKKMIDGNQQMETYQTQLTTLIGDSSAAKDRLAELAKFGAETPFELPELVEAEKVLVGFGLQGEKALKLTGKSATDLRTVLGDVSAGTGVKFQELAVTFGKFSSGATGEAISRFQELGIATKEELKKMGVEFDKAGSFVSPIDKALTATTQIMQTKFGGGMKALSETAGGQLSTLNDNIEQSLTKIGAPIFDVFKKVVSGINVFLSSGFFSGILDTVTGIFSVVFDTIGGILSRVGEAFTPVIAAVQRLFDAFGSGPGIIEKLTPIFSALFDVLVEVGKFLLEIFVISLEETVTIVSALIDAGASLVSMFFDTKKEVKGAGDETAKTSSVFDTIKNVIISLRGGIAGTTAAFREIKEVIGEFFNALVRLDFSKVADILKGSGERVGKAFADGAKTKVDEIKTNTESAFQKLNQSIQDLALQQGKIPDAALNAQKAALINQVEEAKKANSITEANYTTFIGRLKDIGAAATVVDKKALEQQAKALEQLQALQIKSAAEAIENEEAQKLEKLRIAHEGDIEKAKELAKSAGSTKQAQELLSSTLISLEKAYEQDIEKIRGEGDKKRQEAAAKAAKEARDAKKEAIKLEIDTLKDQESLITAKTAEAELQRLKIRKEIAQKTFDLEAVSSGEAGGTENQAAKKERLKTQIAKLEAETRLAERKAAAEAELDLDKRAYELQLIELEKSYEDQREAAGKNASLLEVADKDYLDKKAALEEAYRRKTDTLYNLQATLQERVQQGQITSVSAALNTVLEVSQKSQNILSGVLGKTGKDLAEAAKSAVKDFTGLSSEGVSVLEKIGQQSLTVIGKQIKDSSDLMASFKKIIISGAFDLLQAQLPVWIAGIFGNELATKGVFGLPSAFSLTAILTGLVQIARGALGYWKGGPITGGEQLIRVNEKGQEFITNAQATKKNMELLKFINNGGNWLDLAAKYILPSVYIPAPVGVPVSGNAQQHEQTTKELSIMHRKLNALLENSKYGTKVEITTDPHKTVKAASSRKRRSSISGGGLQND